MRVHPPRCIKPYTGTPTPTLCNYIQNEYGLHTTVFAVRCECGHTQLRIRLARSPRYTAGPIYVVCSKCRTGRLIFDPTKHGYDGELGHNDQSEDYEYYPFLCPKCKGDTFVSAFGFQYSGETDILKHLDVHIQPEDLFGWCMLAGTCVLCQHTGFIYEMECA